MGGHVTRREGPGPPLPTLCPPQPHSRSPGHPPGCSGRRRGPGRGGGRPVELPGLPVAAGGVRGGLSARRGVESPIPAAPPAQLVPFGVPVPCRSPSRPIPTRPVSRCPVPFIPSAPSIPLHPIDPIHPTVPICSNLLIPPGPSPSHPIDPIHPIPTFSLHPVRIPSNPPTPPRRSHPSHLI